MSFYYDDDNNLVWEDDPAQTPQAGGPQDPPPSSPGPYPGMRDYPGLTPDQVTSQMQGVESGILQPDSTRILGRTLNGDELKDAQTIYRNQGGDAYRAYLQKRADSQGGGNQSLSGLLSPYGGSFQSPDIDAAVRAALSRISPLADFKPSGVPNIDPFTSTTAEDVYKDPSYGLRLKTGEQALLNNKAAQGLVRTGGTLKDLLNYNQQFASNEYGNVDARRRADYTTNRDTTFGTADRTFQRESAAYEPNMLRYSTEANIGQRAGEQAHGNAWNEFLQDYDSWRNQQTDTFSKLKWQSEFGRDTAAM